ncbi:MAG: class I SAM-dependent methyltransferase [Chloroflexi bacterium]|nr:class I SAM-dependent methyltransferase [Chloroflexota bacterium]
MWKFLRPLLERQTRASFEYQWKNLPVGRGLLSDQRFRDRVKGIIPSQELCVDPGWLKGRDVIDVGCGNGRWTYGFLELGARVTAFDQSPSAIESIRASSFDQHPNLRLAVGNIYTPPPEVLDRRYDLVWCWGVAHHVADTARAIRVLATQLMKEDGLLYLYIYSRQSYTRKRRLELQLQRYLLAPLPFKAKEWVLHKRYRGRGVHGAFDRLSPTINTLYTYEDIEDMCKEAGLQHVERTIDHTELFLRAYRDNCSARAFFTPKPTPPYWFQQMPLE